MKIISTTENHKWFSKAPEASSAKTDIKIKVSRENTFLDWYGFGCCFNERGAWSLNHAADHDQNIVMDFLFDNSGDHLGLNYCRVPIGANDYALDWYSHNETPGDYAMAHFDIARDDQWLIPYIERAINLNPKITLHASPWSPPTWMKKPPVYNHGNMVMEKQNLDAFALYLLKFAQAYRARGLPLHDIHIQNEPYADQKFPSCVWTGEQLRDVIRDHVGPLFEKELPAVGIWLGTLNEDDNLDRVLPTIADPEAMKYTKGIGLQWWSRHAIQQIFESVPDLPIVQTESECSDGSNTWKQAHDIFDVMLKFIRGGCRGYTFWNPILPPKGLSTWGWPQNSLISIDDDGNTVYNPESAMLRHAAVAARDAVSTMKTVGNWSGCTLAWKDTEGQIGLAMHNPTPDAHSINVDLDGDTASFVLEPHSFHTVVG